MLHSQENPSSECGMNHYYHMRHLTKIRKTHLESLVATLSTEDGTGIVHTVRLWRRWCKSCQRSTSGNTTNARKETTQHGNLVPLVTLQGKIQRWIGWNWQQIRQEWILSLKDKPTEICRCRNLYKIKDRKQGVQGWKICAQLPTLLAYWQNPSCTIH